MPKHTFIAMVQIETDDPRLSHDARLAQIKTPTGVAETRRLVLQTLPHQVTRLIATLPVEHARLLMKLHEAVGEDLGGNPVVRPPPGYVPPTRD